MCRLKLFLLLSVVWASCSSLQPHISPDKVLWTISNPKLWAMDSMELHAGPQNGRSRKPLPMYRFSRNFGSKGKNLPKKQGLILGCEGRKDHVIAIVDTDDIHAMVTAASGAGKTAYFLYPNIEYALATGMSFLCTDTKGDLFRNYAGIAKENYGFQIAVLDLRNPTWSDGNNLLHLINRYMDVYKTDPKDLSAKAKAEKYAKVLAKTLINTSGGDSGPVWTERLLL